MIQVRNAGPGLVYEAEADAVRWVAAQGAWSAPTSLGRLNVKRKSRKPYDLLVWPARVEPGSAWGAQRGGGDSLIEECLKLFAAHRRIAGWTAHGAYEVFAQVVAREQRRLQAQQRAVHTVITIPHGVYGGSAFIQDGGNVWPLEIRRVVLRPDRFLLEANGVLDDGSHYNVQANLPNVGGVFTGKVQCVLVESKQPWEADVRLEVTHAAGEDAELEGHWIEGAGEQAPETFEFGLELRRRAE